MKPLAKKLYEQRLLYISVPIVVRWGIYVALRFSIPKITWDAFYTIHRD